MKLTFRFCTAATLALAPLFAARAAVETYVIDPVHSNVGFSIHHFVSKVPGKFAQFSGAISFDADQPERSSVSAVIDIASVNTGNEKRDAHLRSADFFNAAAFPKMTFQSTAWKQTGKDTFDITGNLTIKDVTKPVTLKATLLGIGPGARGAQLSGWEAATTISKAAFNVNGPAVLAAVVGDEVTITIDVEADLKK